ncbi:MAG: hypothetical protein AAF558_10070 [Verrucomicrobiota bacterium]
MSVPLAQISSAAQIVSITTGLMSKNYDPTVDLLKSLGDMLSAVNMKLEAIYSRLDLMHKDIHALRVQVANIPARTVDLEMNLKLRAGTRTLSDFEARRPLYYGNEAAFYKDLEKEVDRHREDLLNYAESCRERGYDGILNIIIAGDALVRGYMNLFDIDAANSGIDLPMGRVVSDMMTIEQLLDEAINAKEIGLIALKAETQREVFNIELRGINRVTPHTQNRVMAEMLPRGQVQVLRPVFQLIYQDVPGDGWQVTGSRRTGTSYHEVKFKVIDIDLPDDFIETKVPGLLYDDASVKDISKSEMSDRYWHYDTSKGSSVVNELGNMEEKYNRHVAKHFEIAFALKAATEFQDILKQKIKDFKDIYAL